MGFLEKNAADPTIASAILTAPQALSGLNDTELARVKRKAELHALSPEVAEAKASTEKVLAEVERGCRQAINTIGQRVGLVKGPDGTWSHPSMAAA